jgi:3-oxoacyl-[acyl-carrier protein] reductase
MAITLGEKGAKVAVNYAHDDKAAEEVVKMIETNGGEAIAVKADVSTLEGGRQLLDATIKAWGHLDILVLNAGIMGSRAMEDVDEDFFDEHIQANVKAPLFMAKAATEYLPTRKSHLSPFLDSFGL